MHSMFPRFSGKESQHEIKVFLEERSCESSDRGFLNLESDALIV